MNLTALVSLILALNPAVVANVSDDGSLEVPHFADNFANHYKCYSVELVDAEPWPPRVELRDQFKASQNEVIKPRYLCNPVSKNHGPLPAPELHYVCFEIAQPIDPVFPLVKTFNQFGAQLLKPVQAELLCLPSKKVHV